MYNVYGTSIELCSPLSTPQNPLSPPPYNKSYVLLKALISSVIVQKKSDGVYAFNII